MATSRAARTPATPGSDVQARLVDPGFTPSVKMLGDLLALFTSEDDDAVKAAERAILRIEGQYASRIAKATTERASAAARPARGRLTHLAGRLAQDQRDPDGLALAWVLEALEDADPKTRRAAARALGKLERSPRIEAALASAFDRATNDDDKRALAIALGKVGGASARERLAGGEHGRASVIVERELARQTPGAVALAHSFDGPCRIWFHTRSGLEDVLKEEVSIPVGKARFVAPGVVETQISGPLAAAAKIRTAIEFGFPLAPVDVEKGHDLASSIARAIASPAAIAIFRAFTVVEEGAAIRFRLAFTRGGHRRAVVWRVAELVRAESRELVNDPQASTWEVRVDEVGSKLKIELVPRGYVDDRFAWRQDLVAASSHPAIAAALVRVAPRSDADVMWDPFAGAGAELVERAKIAPYSKLLGTDTDSRAVAAARANLERAGVDRATIELADACEHAPDGVNLIVTNPPMGRRVQRGAHAELLERFVSHAARVLVPGGALVWLLPDPARIRERAAAAGLELDRAFTVDMGGFPAELAVFVKRHRPRADRTKRSPGPASPNPDRGEVGRATRPKPGPQTGTPPGVTRKRGPR